MTKRTQISRVAQAVSGTALLAIALTVGLTGMRLNILNGLQVSVEAAVIFACGDAARLVLPLVAGIIGWSRPLKIVALICVTASLFCAVTAFNSGSEQLLATKQAGADKFEMAKVSVTKAENRVSSLDAQILKEGRDRGCGPACKALKQEAERARIELAATQAKLETAKPIAVSGTEMWESRIKSILLIAIVEALVWLSLPAVVCFKMAFAKPKTVVKKKRMPTKPKNVKAIDKTNIVDFPPRLTKSGKIDGRSKSARAVKKVTSRVMA